MFQPLAIGGQLSLVRVEDGQRLQFLARCQPYLTDGAPELGWIIRAVDERQWDDLPWLVADLQTARFDPTLVQSAIIDILREEPQAAEALVSRGARENPDDPIWDVLRRALDHMLSAQWRFDDESADDELDYLLVGLGGGDRDPRQLLARLLAMDHPAWLVWSAVELASHPLESEGGLWSTYLAARAQERLGNLEESEALSRAILEDHKDFVPAWDLLERVTLAGVPRPDHPRYVRVQLSRQRNFGSRENLGPQDFLVAAQAKIQEGLVEEAVGLLEEARQLAPENRNILHELAKLRHKRLEYVEGFEAYRELVAVIDPGPGHYVVYEFLDLLEEAAAARTDLQPAVLEQVESLSLRLPTDPRVALSVALRELETGPMIPEIRLGRAFRRLEEFRVATEYRRLDDLAPNSTRSWVEFYMLHDPEAAHALVESELDKEPSSLDHWHMLGESFLALGKREEAIETFEFIQRMLPDSRTTRALAHIYSRTGRDTDKVSALASQTIKLERIRSRDIDLQIAVARSLVNNLGTAARDKGIELLQDLWDKRGRARGADQVAEIGELYGLALSWRADTRDRTKAHEVLTEIGPLIDDPARRHMIRAVSNLALTMFRQR